MAKVLKILCYALLAQSACWTPTALANPTKPLTVSQIHVTLFGQPCALRGPFDESTLKAIHAISPEQTYSIRTAEDAEEATSAEVKQSLNKISKPALIPPAGLDRYRERLALRLRQLEDFFQGAELARKTHSPSELIETGGLYLKGVEARSFDELAERFAENQKTDVALKARLFDLYSSAIEPDPEEEFHLAIQRLNVSYSCAFDGKLEN
jgi:hypothetical protein